jgi:hypothetical protein
MQAQDMALMERVPGMVMLGKKGWNETYPLW